MRLTQGEKNAMTIIKNLFVRYQDDENDWKSVEGTGIRATTLGNLKAKGLIEVRTWNQPVENWTQNGGMTRRPAHEAEVRII